MNTALALVFLFHFWNMSPPTGTIGVKGHFVGKTEVLNIHWLEYLHYKSQELDSTQLDPFLPASTNLAYRSPGERFKPIVQISYEQATGYCEWLSRVVSQRTGQSVIYRLPKPAEWKEIAHELIKVHAKDIDHEMKETKKGIEKAAGSYFMNDRREPKEKVYDLFTNVSEMTSEKGLALGANNKDLTDVQSNLTREVRYDAPGDYVGFRFIAEIVKQ